MARVGTMVERVDEAQSQGLRASWRSVPGSDGGTRLEMVWSSSPAEETVERSAAQADTMPRQRDRVVV
jgi:hypothetical protein